MGKAKKTPLERSVVQAIAELEKLTDEIQLKLHLARLRAKAAPSDKPEPPLSARREHARHANTSSRARPSRARRDVVGLDDGDAFLPDFRRGFVAAADGDAEAFGEEFVAAATSAEAVGEFARDEVVDEELGGWYTEVAYDDASPGSVDAPFAKAR